ncbi:hypothetical protein AEA09_06850 [Lysinibacillus contaminans]|uniref:SWIM-type domain-containing protein n=1 Tax=Lysinibacillus contaminans TaxID=1293441 RepID=A0ABR5K0K6_9BACI|nr:SWIM zinc finger family protein [Lysinibacillus contaminans]KOS68303.1 hypothetical protein AEA09_06850 [Lysinibacillus contaminans]
MNLQNFDKYISSTIVKRGKSYFKNGHVIALIHRTSTEWQAEVTGSDSYDVEVQLADTDEIVSSSCDCPYDGPYCKHEVAVFYALQQEPKKEMSSLPLEIVLNEQSKEDLLAFLLELAQKNTKLQQQLMQRFLTTPKKIDPYTQAQETITYSLQKVHRKGYLAWNEVPDALHCIEQALDTAHGCITEKQYGTAYKIAILCYEKTTELLEISEYHDMLDEILAESLACLEIALVDGLNIWSLDEQGHYFEHLVEMSKLPIFEDETDAKLTLLEQALPFCQDPIFAQRLQDYLATLTLSDHYQNKIENLQLQALMQWAEEEDMLTHLQAHPDNPDMRETVILHYIEQQNHEQVLSLCAEGVEIDFNDRYLRQKWEEYAYQAHKALGNKQAMRAIAFPLAVEGSMEFYEALKTLYSNDEWPEILQDLLLSFDEMPSYPFWYAIKMIEEQQWAVLLRYCKKHPEFLENYARYLIQDYREDVKALFMQKLTKEASTASNRGHYQALRKTLQNFKNLGFTEEVASIITQLKKQYPKRPALHDELANIH